ncbi:MAG: hypothetical protein OCC45_04015 [Desulfotalea sp.]
MTKLLTPSLESVTSDITSLPYVAGIVFCTYEAKVLCNFFNEAQGSEHLEEFLKGIVNLKGIISLLRMTEQLNMECVSLESKLRKLTVLAYKVDEEHIICIFFTQEANKRLIRMMLLNHLNAIRKVLIIKDPTLNKIIIRPSLRPRLDIISGALRNAIPGDSEKSISSIMESSIQKWASLGPVTKKELPVLADILCACIANADHQKQFLKDIEDTFLGIR